MSAIILQFFFLTPFKSNVSTKCSVDKLFPLEQLLLYLAFTWKGLMPRDEIVHRDAETGQIKSSENGLGLANSYAVGQKGIGYTVCVVVLHTPC